MVIAVISGRENIELRINFDLCRVYMEELLSLQIFGEGTGFVPTCQSELLTLALKNIVANRQDILYRKCPSPRTSTGKSKPAAIPELRGGGKLAILNPSEPHPPESTQLTMMT
jgi:hypothetical protein